MSAHTMTWTKTLTLVAAAIVMAVAVTVTPTRLYAQTVSYTPGVLPDTWFSGGPDCAVFQQDFQIHAYNDNF